jgi:hypothetical protein
MPACPHLSSPSDRNLQVHSVPEYGSTRTGVHQQDSVGLLAELGKCPKRRRQGQKSLKREPLLQRGSQQASQQFFPREQKDDSSEQSETASCEAEDQGLP